MNSLIYDPFTEDEFTTLTQKSLQKYGHNELARKYIMSLYTIKEHVCATFTQFMLSFGHISTQHGEGFNNQPFKNHSPLNYQYKSSKYKKADLQWSHKC